MPASNGFDAEGFAKLVARFDTGNPCEAEAMNAARAMRRRVAEQGLRFVDVMERADVKQALDAQLQPVREDSAELKEAFGKVAQLAEALAEEKEITARLRAQMAAAPSGPNQSGSRTGNSRSPASATLPVFGAWNEVLVVLVTAVAAVLLILGAFRHERRPARGIARAASAASLPKGARHTTAAQMRRRKSQAARVARAAGSRN